MSKHALIITTVSGFVQKFERENVRLLQGLGYKVHYAANPRVPAYQYPPDTYQQMDVVFHSIPILQEPKEIHSNMNAYRMLKHLVRKYHISLVHCHTPVGGMLGRLLGKHFGPSLKVIYTAHGFHFYREAGRLQHPLIYRIERGLARYTDVLITINREDYQAANNFSLRSQGNVYQIHGAGIDLTAFPPATEAERTASRKDNSITADIFWMVSVGELNQNKNHAVLLSALRYLLQSGVDKKKVHLTICGEGRERKHLEEMIQAYGLTECVTLQGYVDQPRTILAGADIFLFPGRREGLGMAAIEALATGVPVIAANNRGSREYLQDGINGFGVGWNDARGFALMIMRYMTMRPEMINKMRSAAIQSAKLFDQADTRTRMHDIYQKVDQSIESK